jgi:hypothetical protein
VIVFARTEAREKVQSWNNYWYYVELDILIGGPSATRGWMYGEFVATDAGK